MPERFPNFLAYRNVTVDDVNNYPLKFEQPADLQKFELYFSDSAIVADPEVDQSVVDYAKTLNIPMAVYEKDSDIKDKAAQINELIEQL